MIGAVVAVMVVAGAALLARRNLGLAICAAIPTVLFLRGVPTALPLGGAVTLGLVAGAAAGGALPRIRRLWLILLPLVLLVIWVIGARLLPGTRGAIDPLTTKDLLAFITGPILFALALAADVSRRRVDGVLMLTGTIAGWCALAFGSSYDTDHRVTLFGLNPNFLAVIFVLGLVAATTELRRGSLVLVAITVPGMVVGLVLTQSRGGLFSLGAGMAAVVLGWVLDGRPRRFGRIDIPVMVAVAIVGAAIPYITTANVGGGGFGRSSQQLAHNTDARLSAAALGFHLAKAHPIRGVGLGRFPVIAASDPEVHLYIDTHDDYVRLAAETGFVGLGLFVIAIGVAVLGVGWRDLESGAVPFSFLVLQLFINGLGVIAVCTGFWVTLGLRYGRRSTGG